MEELKDVLTYDPSSGDLRWKIFCGGERPGAIAGTMDGGYRKVGYQGKRYLAHRVAWFLHFGVEPIGQVDHMDGNPSNNVITNLRLATHSENQQNQRAPSSRNTSGFLGVQFSKARRKFVAKIGIDGKQIFIGRFDTAEEAYQAYLAKKRLLHPFCTI
ncbi:HNH endonuclease [Janthinobacterium sp. GB4P2]|uniref:HNH endonuclease n=1 Tax=Janthinobacterium sp. GB4P2 TaxID=3424189 RepID=UPI003F228012